MTDISTAETADISIEGRFRRCEVVAPLSRGEAGQSRILALDRGRLIVGQLWFSGWRIVQGEITFEAGVLS